jgi:hypothetical protein
MKKFIKIAALVFVLLFAVLISIPFLFKDKIVAKVKEEANKNLNATVNFGEFDISIISSFPNLKFSINELSIIGKDDFLGDTLIFSKITALNLNLMSVIKGEKYQINSIVINNATINALVNKLGKANWDITKPCEPSAPSAESSNFKMQLSKFEIQNSKIVYDDKQMGFKTKLIGLNHILKGDFTQDVFLMETLTEIEKWSMMYGGIAYLKNVRTKIKADLDANMPAFKFTFKNNEFELNDLKLGLDGYFAMPKEDMDMDLKFNCSQTSFASFLSLIPGCYTSDFKDIKTKGSFSLSAFVKGIYNDKKMPAFAIDLIVSNASFQYPSLPKSVNNINLDVKVKNPNGNPDRTSIDINKFHAEMGNNPLDVAMHILTPVSDPFVDGTIKGRVDLNSIKEFVPLESDQKLNGVITADVYLKGNKSTIDNKKYSEFIAKGNFMVENMNYVSKEIPYGMSISKAVLNFTPKAAELTQFNSRIGKSDLNASGKIENFIGYALADEKLKGKFFVNSNYLDVNEIMGEQTTAETSADTSKSGIVEVPANIDFELDGNFSRMLYSNMDMRNVKGKIVVRDSKVSMQDLFMLLLDGSMVLNGSYSTANLKKPEVDFNMKIENFDLSKTVKTFNTIEKLAPIAKQSNGKFSTLLAFTSNLKQDMSPELTTLNGEGKLQTKQLVITNFPMFSKIADAIKMPEYKNLPLNNTNLSFSFKNGRVNVQPFDVKIKNSVFNIGGSQGFDQTIDYKVKAEVQTKDLGAGANQVASNLTALANSKGANFSVGDKITLNMVVTGTVADPKLDAGLSDLKNNLKDQARAELEKKKKELEDKARAEADKKKAELENKANAELEKKKTELEAKRKAEEDKLKAEADKKKKELEEKAKAEAEKKKKEVEDKAKKEAEKKLKGLLGR